MGQRVTVEHYDDLDPDQEATHTDEILWKGKVMEVDLSEENHLKLMALLEPFVAVARKKGSANATTPAVATSSPKTAEERRAEKERAEIRRWAQRNGYELGVRGRIPADVIKDFHKHEGKDIPKFEDPDPAPQ